MAVFRDGVLGPGLIQAMSETLTREDPEGVDEAGVIIGDSVRRILLSGCHA
jgi:hypothetical protein